MIEYGSDYLLGLASFAPDKFAERDRLWHTEMPDITRSLTRCSISGMSPFEHPFLPTNIPQRCSCT